MANIKISELSAVTSLDGTELIEVVQSGTNKKATVSQVLPYKVYTALLTQTGTDAPVATVLQNTLGGEVVWYRDDVGVYFGGFTGAFPSGKSFSLTQSVFESTLNRFETMVISVDEVEFRTSAPDGSLQDDLLRNTPIQIQVYP